MTATHQSIEPDEEDGTWLQEPALLALSEQHWIVQLRPADGLACVGAMTPDLAIHPSVSTLAGVQENLDITVLSVDGLAEKTLRGHGHQVTQGRTTQMGWHRVDLTIPAADLATVSAVWGIFHIEMQPRYEMHGERGAQTAAGNYAPGGTVPTGPGYVTWLTSHGLTGGPGLIVQVADDGLDQGIATNAPGTAHADILGRIAGIYNATSDTLGDSRAGHGQINAGIIMGNAAVGTTDAAGHRLGQGMAPAAQVYATKIFDNSGSWDTGSDSLTDLVQDAQDNGALFSSNSWGCSGCAGDYNADAAEYDALVRDADPSEAGNQPMTVFFSSGNSGPGSNTHGAPGTAKNVISIGAGENSDADGTDGCNTGPSESNSLRDLGDFSSRGPQDDGRLGPTLFAVGTHVQGPASTVAGYDGSGVCDQYWPGTQTDYARSSGTSHSTPIACGAGMIVHEYFSSHLSTLSGHPANPSPALIKAVLVNTATDMVGGSDGNGGTLASIPNSNQGWGSVNLSTLLNAPDGSLTSFDQEHTFTASSQTWEILITPVNPALPLKVTLAYTDAPASPGSDPALVNDLDLEVISGGTTYLGNVFSGGVSTTGGSADRLNNLEGVYVPSPSGTYTVRVRAFNIAGDGVPNTGGALDQDFALFVWNGTDQSSRGILSFDASVVQCGDTLTATVSDTDLQGAGTVAVSIASTSGDTEALTLSESTPGSGVLTETINVATGTPAADGTLQVQHGDAVTVIYNDADDGTGNPATVSDTAQVDCEPPRVFNIGAVNIGLNQLTVSFDTDEAATTSLRAGLNVGDSTYTTTGAEATAHGMTLTGLTSCTTILHEITATDKAGNTTVEDNHGLWHRATTFTMGTSIVIEDFEPTAGSGWTHAADQGTDSWAVTEPGNTHSPTHAYTFEPGANAVTDASLVTPPFTGGGSFSFWHSYEIENTYDGAVLEITTNGGADWQDLGSNITQGGYNGTIDTGYGSPIGGQQAWTGGSFGTMTQVMVDLSSFSGTVQVRFRWTSDSSFSSGGWRIDDVPTVASELCPNDLPNAQDDAATTAINAPVTISVLTNDTDGDTLTIDDTTTPSVGGAVINGGTTVTYTPNGGVEGVDSFIYTVRDGQGGAGTALVTVLIGNRATVIGNVLDYLLGVTSDPTGLDANANDVVDASDLVLVIGN